MVYRDHNLFTFTHKMKKHNQKLARWRLLLQENNLVIKHVKGKDNVVVDALSCLMVDG